MHSRPTRTDLHTSRSRPPRNQNAPRTQVEPTIKKRSNKINESQLGTKLCKVSLHRWWEVLRGHPELLRDGTCNLSCLGQLDICRSVLVGMHDLDHSHGSNDVAHVSSKGRTFAQGNGFDLATELEQVIYRLQN